MTNETSITRPLMLALTGTLVIFWLVALGLGVLVLRHELDEVFDSALQETAERLLALTIDDVALRRQVDGSALAGLNRTGRREYLVYQVRDASGRVILKSDDAPSAVIEAKRDTGFSDTPKYRVFTAKSPDGSLVLQVADRFANRREAVRESAVTMLIPLLFLIPASILATWLVIGRSLTPIGTLRREIATKDGGNMAPLDETSLPRELEPIAHSVNLLLERLRNAFAAERAFTANSAHELRTPIAGALAQTQRLVEELPDGPERTRARKVEGALSDLGRLTEKLLQLARADSGIGAKRTDVDLLDVLDLVLDDLKRSPNDQGRIVYDRGTLPSLVRQVDADAFGIVLRNLLENALLHGDRDAPVAVTVREDAIRVTNGCDVIADDQLAGLKQRFHRGNTTAAGSRLGLAIADRMIAEMGGTLTLSSPAPGSADGFEATIRL